MANKALQILWALVLCFVEGVFDWLRWLLPERFAKSVDGDVVVITGGGSGIGRLVSLRLAARGAVIVTVDVNKKGNEETVTMIQRAGGEAYSYTCDLSRKEDIYATADKILDEVGPVSMLINNAGIVSGQRLLDIPDAKIELTFKVNVLSHFWTLKAFLPGMQERRKGHIVSVASMAGLSGISKLSDYCASKFAAVGLDESLRLELLREGHAPYIKTTVICPYYIRTGMFEGVKSKLLPILDPDWVADSIVNGVLTDTEVVLLPWWMRAFDILNHVLPKRGSSRLASIVGFNSSMDEFVGREKQK